MAPPHADKMPRRALVFITALVLALHWLLLSGVPLAWDRPAQPSTQVFSTRSIAAPPPSAAAAGVAAAATVAAVPPVAPAPRPAAAPKPRPQPETRVSSRPKPSEPTTTQVPLATQTPDPTTLPDTLPPPSTEAGAAPTATSSAAESETPSAQEPPLATTTPETPATATATAQPASPPQPSEATAGVEITTPGAGTGTMPDNAPPPVRLPPPMRLVFDVSGQAKKFAYSARAELRWQHDGSRYEARQEISAFLVGSRAQRSVGAITAQGLLPERFSDRSRSEQAAHFDHAKGRVTFSANTPEAAVGPGVQDRLSVFIQLGALLAADPARFVTGSQITLTTVSARSADRWTFTLEGPETLDLPSGATPTLKLQRLPRKDYDQKAELWVAPALGYLPVRIKLTQANGDFADLQLRSSGTP